MASDKYAEGRKAAFQNIESIIKTERKNAVEADLTNFTGNKKVFTKSETKSFFKDSLQAYYDVVQNDLSALQNGKDTGDIREIPPYETDDTTFEAGQISAYRDMYNIVKEIDTAEATSPVPSTITRLQKKKVALAQQNILGFAQNELAKHIASKGQDVTHKYQQAKSAALADKRPAPVQNGQPVPNNRIQQGFNAQSQPSVPNKNFAGINLNYVMSFDDKNLLHPADMDNEEKAYMEGLQEIVTVIENYKSVIKKKDFSNITGVSMPARNAGDVRTAEIAASHSSFCRTHSYEVIRTARDSAVALMKGADPHEICKKIPANDEKTGKEKAFADIGRILSEMNPKQFEINHSHGFRLSVHPQRVTKMAAAAAYQTTSEIGSLVKALSKADNAKAFLQTGILETMAGQQHSNSVASRIRIRRGPQSPS